MTILSIILDPKTSNIMSFPILSSLVSCSFIPPSIPFPLCHFLDFLALSFKDQNKPDHSDIFRKNRRTTSH
jgi:hypothetical protein